MECIIRFLLSSQYRVAIARGCLGVPRIRPRARARSPLGIPGVTCGPSPGAVSGSAASRFATRRGRRGGRRFAAGRLVRGFVDAAPHVGFWVVFLDCCAFLLVILSSSTFRPRLPPPLSWPFGRPPIRARPIETPRQTRRGKLESTAATPLMRSLVAYGAVAQLGERCVRNAEVEGSTPFRSTLLQVTLDKALITCRWSAVQRLFFEAQTAYMCGLAPEIDQCRS